MRSTSTGLLGLLVPGVGHAYIGRRRLALLFALPVIALATPSPTPSASASSSPPASRW